MIKAIIFDLDGTLLNTLEDLADSVNHVLSSHNMKTRTTDEVRRFVGNGIPKLMERAVPKDSTPETIADCTKEMIDYYKEHALIKTAPYEGILPLIDYLKSKNIRTAVVTNKAESAAKILCDSVFGDIFTVVIGDNGKSRLKPYPDSVFRALDALNTEKEEALYVGDSEVDMITAKNAGLKSVGVLWGFRTEKILRENGADVIISDPKEIKTLILT